MFFRGDGEGNKKKRVLGFSGGEGYRKQKQPKREETLQGK